METGKGATWPPVPDLVRRQIVPLLLKPFAHGKTVFLGPHTHRTGVNSAARDASDHIPLEVVRVALVHETVDDTSLVGTFCSTTVQSEGETRIL